jgi:hypothetical protein
MLFHQKIKGNKTDCEELVTRITQLVGPIRDTLKAQNTTDIDHRLKGDLEHFKQYISFPHGVFDYLMTFGERDLEKICNILQVQVNRHASSRAVNVVADSEDILRCKELIDQGFKRFEVKTMLAQNTSPDFSTRSTPLLRYEWIYHICAKILISYDCKTWSVVIVPGKFDGSHFS